MPSTAGQMTQTPTGNPQWRACNGTNVQGFQAPYAPQTNRPHTGTSYGTYRDWVLRMGYNRTKGIAELAGHGADRRGETGIRRDDR